MAAEERKMRILIAYDGSSSADEALEDLRFAGLPPEADAVVLSVAEQWLPQLIDAADSDGTDEDPDVPSDASKGLGEAATLGNHAKKKVESIFPGWSVSAKALVGSPALEILTAAEETDADLIVAGSQGRTAVGRLLLGSISQKVLAEAKCSVRIGRAPERGHRNGPVIIIGFDGSPGSDYAVEAVANRHWLGPCSIHLVTASDTLVPTAIGRFIPPIVKWVEEEVKTERETIRKLAEGAFLKLQNAGCDVNLNVRNGNPKQVIVEEAEKLGADCIFLGANSYSSKLERFLIGSTSTAVAARSHCSVEVIRPAS
jgi:nucleotide-binding universal stress UspA family protein